MASPHPAPDDRTRVLPVPAPAGASPGGRPGGGRRRRRRFGFGRALLFVIVLLLALLLLLGWLAWSRIDKVDAIPDDDARAAQSVGRVYLLVGSDSREGLDEEERGELATGDVSGQRTDTIMLLHLPESGRPALVSLPRDSLVEIPGYGEERINAAYAFGGAPLLVETVESATGVRVDDYVEIGFGGFASIVDGLGGVQVCLDEAIQDPKAGLDLPVGCQELDGPDALGYARTRYTATADLGRVQRQRDFLGAIADKAISPATLLNPLTLVRTTLAGGDALVLDEDTGPIDLARFAVGLRSVTGGGGDTLTVPLGSIGNTVTWDPELSAQLFAALREGEEVPPAVLAAARAQAGS